MKRPIKTSRPLVMLKPHEFEALLKSAPQKLLPAIVLGGFCGFRLGEIWDLQWSKFNFTGKYVLITNVGKTRHRRIVPVQDAAVAWLAPIAKKSGRVVYYRSLSTMTSALQQYGKTAGMEWIAHRLRHSAISYLFAKNENITQTANELGIPAKRVVEHFVQPHKAEAERWFAIFPVISNSHEGVPKSGSVSTQLSEDDSNP